MYYKFIITVSWELLSRMDWWISRESSVCESLRNYGSIFYLTKYEVNVRIPKCAHLEKCFSQTNKDVSPNVHTWGLDLYATAAKKNIVRINTKNTFQKIPPLFFFCFFFHKSHPVLLYAVVVNHSCQWMPVLHFVFVILGMEQRRESCVLLGRGMFVWLSITNGAFKSCLKDSIFELNTKLWIFCTSWGRVSKKRFHVVKYHNTYTYLAVTLWGFFIYSKIS